MRSHCRLLFQPLRAATCKWCLNQHTDGTLASITHREESLLRASSSGKDMEGRGCTWEPVILPGTPCGEKPQQSSRKHIVELRGSIGLERRVTGPPETSHNPHLPVPARLSAPGRQAAPRERLVRIKHNTHTGGLLLHLHGTLAAACKMSGCVVLSVISTSHQCSNGVTGSTEACPQVHTWIFIL